MLETAILVYSTLNGVRVKKLDSLRAFKKKDKIICISKSQRYYAESIVKFFDFYFNSVKKVANQREQECLKGLKGEILDFSNRAKYEVRGWPYFPVCFSSFPESFETSLQYLDALELGSGQTILDAGGYSGFSAMVFMNAMSNSGRVISIEPDPENIKTTRLNFQKYKDFFGVAPELIPCAVWSQNCVVNFQAEGNEGSFVAGLSSRDNKLIKVRAKTLTQICKERRIERCDAIKLDIEGAELEAFSDIEFFRFHKPKIVFEGFVKGYKSSRTKEAVSILNQHGYTTFTKKQKGSNQRLIVANFDG